jgi:formamidopyrimidine-DNA glycosylase
MPELPEVETVRRGLASSCIGKKIDDVQALHPRVTNPRSIGNLNSITGARIKNVDRRGKFLWFELDGPMALVAHVGMSGQFRIQKMDTPDETHLRARITFVGVRAAVDRTELRFIDQRTFGWLALSEYSDGVPELVSKIGLDIFDSNFDRRAVIARLRKSRSEIKRMLLDQNVMSGVGNIYADESLWLARIHPQSQASELSARKMEKLLEATQTVMSQALVEGGTSFDSLYINVNGESGYFERSLQAYGRADQPCGRCGTLIRRIIVGGRSSHFCPKCQRL